MFAEANDDSLRVRLMPEALSPEIEQLVQKYVDGRRYTSANDVILVALRLFNEFQQRSRAEVGAAIQRGFDQVDRGEGIALASDDALQQFFDDIKRRGRERCEARTRE